MEMPNVWAITATSSRKASATRNRRPGLDDLKTLVTSSTKMIPTTIPTARPSHANAPRTNPSREPPHAASASSATSSASKPFTPGSIRGSQQPGVGEEAGVGDHTVVGPHGLAVDVPGPLQHLEGLGHPERRVVERFTQARDLEDRRQVREEDAAREQRLLGVRYDLPWLRQVEHDAIE